MHAHPPTDWILLASIPRSTIKEDVLMNEEIQATIGKRAREARSKNDLVNAIFASFAEHAVDPTQVSLEDMKTAVVVAHRSARENIAGYVPRCLA